MGDRKFLRIDIRYWILEIRYWVLPGGGSRIFFRPVIILG